MYLLGGWGEYRARGRDEADAEALPLQDVKRRLSRSEHQFFAGRVRSSDLVARAAMFETQNII